MEYEYKIVLNSWKKKSEEGKEEMCGFERGMSLKAKMPKFQKAAVSGILLLGSL